MEREKLISTLQEKVGNNDFSRQTLGGIIDMNPLADGVEPDEAYWERTVNFVKILQGQYNHDFSTKFQTEVNKKVEDFKKTYKPETKPQTPPAEPQPNKEVEELKRQFGEIRNKLSAYEGRQAQERLKADVLGKLKGKCENADVLDLAMQTYGELDVKKDSDVIAKEVETKYNALVKRLYGDGYKPQGGGGTKPLTSTQAKAAQENFRQQLIHSGRLPKPTTAQ